ncbi:hypothetical protein Golomagni_06853, partial [Golovinomyces magnicellulatus]
MTGTYHGGTGILVADDPVLVGVAEEDGVIVANAVQGMVRIDLFRKIGTFDEDLLGDTGAVGEVDDLAHHFGLDHVAILAEQTSVVVEMVGVDLIVVADDRQRRRALRFADGVAIDILYLLQNVALGRREADRLVSCDVECLGDFDLHFLEACRGWYSDFLGSRRLCAEQVESLKGHGDKRPYANTLTLRSRNPSPNRPAPHGRAGLRISLHTPGTDAAPIRCWHCFTEHVRSRSSFGGKDDDPYLSKMRVDVKKFEYSMDPDSDRVSFGIAAGFFTAGSIEPRSLPESGHSEPVTSGVSRPEDCSARISIFGAETPACKRERHAGNCISTRQVIPTFSLEPNPPGTLKPRYTPSRRNNFIMAEKELKEISKAELAKHNTKEDLWFIIHNKVYDVTKYQTEHPGGIEVLMQLAADDASEMFEATGHSDEARKKLDKLIVGQLPSEDREDDVEVFHK